MKKKSFRKKRHGRNIYSTIFIILVAIFLVSSIFAFFSNSQTGGKMHGYKIYPKENYYLLEKDRKLIKIYTNPLFLFNDSTKREMKDLNILLNSSSFWFSFDPNMDEDYLYYIDISRFTLNENLRSLNTGTEMKEGIMNHSNRYFLPLIDCRNASEGEPVILLKSLNSFNTGNLSVYPIIEKKDNCIIIQIFNPYQPIIVGDYISILFSENGKKEKEK